jgi:hypothetical protein
LAALVLEERNSKEKEKKQKKKKKKKSFWTQKANTSLQQDLVTAFAGLRLSRHALREQKKTYT